jgi:heme-degrading monooxygenase HmoA
MKKNVLWILLTMMAACSGGPRQNEGVVEVVVSRVKPEYVSRMPQLAADARKIIETYDGFISWETLKADDTSRVFVDIIHWRSKADAEKAFEKFHPTESCSAIMQAFDREIYFGHTIPY